MKVVDIAVFLVVISYLEGAKLPNYVKACSMSAPDLNKCAAKNGQDAISTIVKGDSKYKIPNMLPLKVTEVNFTNGNLHTKLDEIQIFGLENAHIKDFKIELQEQHVWIKIAIDRVNMLANYNMEGKVLILSIKGQGTANVTLVGGVYEYSFDYTLKERDGESYVHISNNHLDYTTHRSYFHFDNLFGGDKALGDGMNEFLNDNWKEVQHDIGPAVTHIISTLITNTVNGIFNIVPYNQIFLP